MRDFKITVAAIPSVLCDIHANLEWVRKACEQASKDNARMILLPELALTGHGGHKSMLDHAEEVPSGPLSQKIIEFSKTYDLCICVGIAEKINHVTYNSQMVADRGEYLGLQRKINMSRDESLYFSAGEEIELFEIDEVRFGITICFDNLFPEMSLIHSIQGAEVVLAPHAARMGPETLQGQTPESIKRLIREQQDTWKYLHPIRASINNHYTVIANAVGSSVEEVDPTIPSLHIGGVLVVSPTGEFVLETEKEDLSAEIKTIELRDDQFAINKGAPRSRHPHKVLRQLEKAIYRRENLAL